jgi:hypothetical protein
MEYYIKLLNTHKTEPGTNPKTILPTLVKEDVSGESLRPVHKISETAPDNKIALADKSLCARETRQIIPFESKIVKKPNGNSEEFELEIARAVYENLCDNPHGKAIPDLRRPGIAGVDTRSNTTAKNSTGRRKVRSKNHRVAVFTDRKCQ